MIRNWMWLMYLLCGLPALGLAQVTVSPSAPKAQETVRVNIPASVLASEPDVPQVTMTGNKVTVTMNRFDCGFGLCPPPISRSMVLGQFPTGAYEVEVRKDGAVIGSATFTVAMRTSLEPLWNHTDLWWEPNESGWGINLVQHGSGIIFATWFVYGDDGRATWYVIPDGRWQNPSVYTGAIYGTTGPALAQTLNPNLVTRTPVGTATFTFTRDADVANADFAIEGKTIRKTLRRQSF